MSRLPSVACLVLWLGMLAGCGLVGPDEPIGFRTYVLKDVGFAEGSEVAHDGLRRYAVGHFGGIGITWDPGTGNLSMDPVLSGPRRLNLYMHLVPRPPDLDIEMLALVERLETGVGGTALGWVQPMMDIPLEQDIYQAILRELLERRAAVPGP